MEFHILLWFLIVVVNKSTAQYVIPGLKLEAFSPTGFKASLPADDLVQLFVFNGKVGSEPLEENEPGEFSAEIKNKTNAYFVYYNPSLKLKIGDQIQYSVYVQRNQLGYKSSKLSWVVTGSHSAEFEKANRYKQSTDLTRTVSGTVEKDVRHFANTKELLSTRTSICDTSVSYVSGPVLVCKNTIVFQDDFMSDSLDDGKWLVEQYIPDEPDYEFVIYKKDNDVVQIENNQLMIKPKLQSDKEVHEGNIDVSKGCTRAPSKNARCMGRMYLLHNPVISGRVVSKTLFSYADIEVKAKLPSGDWMYPEIYLEDENYNRLVIAYSRGNKIFTGNDGSDIGGTLLFGGPMLSAVEPIRSKQLSSYRHKAGPLSDDFHVYRLRWTPDEIELFLDGNRYGNINAASVKSFGFTGTPPVRARLVLGIGVGGINDFPNDYKSGNVSKPWKNRNNVQVKTFYENRDQWLPSWNTGGQLIVDYVKIKSI